MRLRRHVLGRGRGGDRQPEQHYFRCGTLVFPYSLDDADSIARMNVYPVSTTGVPPETGRFEATQR